MDTQDQTPIDQVKGGPACADYLTEQLALPEQSIKTYSDLATTLHTLRDQLNAEHGETMGTMKYMAHLAETETRALSSIGVKT